jgi:hypothetical protein
MTCRDLGQFSVAYNTKDILNSYSSAQKASRRRDIALAMAGRDIDRSGNNQLNRLLAYRKERSIAPEFQEAQIERLAGDNYREKEFQRKQEEAMDWQNNFLYNTALFAKSMLDEPSRFEREDIEEMQQRLQDEGIALDPSFFNPRSRSTSRPARSREPSTSGGAAAPTSVTNAFAQPDASSASMSTAAQNPSLFAGGLTLTNIQSVNVYNMLPPVETEKPAPAPKVKEGKGGRKARGGGSLDTLSAEPMMGINISTVQKLQALVETGKISQEQSQYLMEQELLASVGSVVPRTKSKGGKARPIKTEVEGEASVALGSAIGGLPGASRLGGLDESAVEFELQSGGGGGGLRGAGGSAQAFSSIDPKEIVANDALSRQERIDRLLTLYDFPMDIPNPSGGTDLISDELRQEFGEFLFRFPNLPKRGETAWKRFMSERGQKIFSTSGGR